MIRKFLIVIFVFYYIGLNAQNAKQDVQLLVYNIGFNGIASGVGALINKDKEHKWYQSFIKGFYQGGIGGVLIFSAKKISYTINNKKNYWYVWPSKIVHSAGTSIVENAALNYKFGKNWNIEFWAIRCDFSTGNDSYFKARLSAYSLYTLLYFIPKSDFDWRRSAMTGVIFFSNDSAINGYNGMSNGKGFFVRTNFTPYPEYNEYYITTHELIHAFQFRECEIFNTWLKPFEVYYPKKLKNIFTKYIYLDIPYFSLFYGMEGGHHDYYHYYDNFYELEADHFATNKYVENEKQ